MMIKTKTTTLALLIASTMMLSACGDGNDGKDGVDGSPGSPGDPGTPGTSGLHIDMANNAIANITQASYSSGIISVDFIYSLPAVPTKK